MKQGPLDNNSEKEPMSLSSSTDDENHNDNQVAPSRVARIPTGVPSAAVAALATAGNLITRSVPDNMIYLAIDTAINVMLGLFVEALLRGTDKTVSAVKRTFSNRKRKRTEPEDKVNNTPNVNEPESTPNATPSSSSSATASGSDATASSSEEPPRKRAKKSVPAASATPEVSVSVPVVNATPEVSVTPPANDKGKEPEHEEKSETVSSDKAMDVEVEEAVLSPAKSLLMSKRVVELEEGEILEDEDTNDEENKRSFSPARQ